MKKKKPLYSTNIHTHIHIYNIYIIIKIKAEESFIGIRFLITCSTGPKMIFNDHERTVLTFDV